MKLKKLLALVLASVMAVSLLSACGGGSDSSDTPVETPPAAPAVDTTAVGTVDQTVVDDIQTGYVKHEFSPDNPVEISMWIVTNNGEPAADNKIVQLMKDRLGVTLTMELTTSDNQDTRIGTMLAGGDYPDIIASTHNDALMTAGGAMLRLDDYLATGNWPLLWAHVEPALVKLTYRAGAVETGFYVFPNYNRWYGPQIAFTNWSDPAFWIQKAVLEDAGYPDLSSISVDEYFDLLANYAEKYPTIDGVPTIPFTFDYSEGRQWSVTNNALHVQGGENWGGAFPDPVTGKVRLYIDDEYSYRWAKKLNELNASGLLDPEAFAATPDQFNAKIATGAVLGFPHQRWAFSQGQDSLVAENRYERTYVPVTPTFDGIPASYATGQLMNIHQGMGISIDCANPELILDFLELMMTEEWQKLLFWGIEGDDYLVGADGLYYRTQEMRDLQDDPIWRLSNRFQAFTDQLPKRQGFWPDGNADSAGFQPSEFFESLREYDQNFLAAYDKQYWGQFYGDDTPIMPLYYPIWQMNSMLSDEANLAINQVDAIQYPAYARLVLAAPDDFDSVWDAFIDELALVDVALYLSEINAMIDDINSNN